jgi:N-dimethylarginine dimethylaminohydrolase
MCAPTYADTKIQNNAWMTEVKNKEELKIDREKFMGEWYALYDIVSANALVYLLPPKKGLQDMTYVNSFICIFDPVTKKDNIVLSKFIALGREGEEKVAGKFLKDLGYSVFQSPYNFEGYPELKKINDTTYIGGYGIRSDIRALEWIEKTFHINIIKIKEKDPYLYHLDCSVFVLNKDNIMAYTNYMDKKTIKEIEKIVEIHPVTQVAAYQGICNSARVGDFILNASSLDFMKVTDKYYREEEQKNEELEIIADKIGLEVIYISLSESMKSGALLSCHITPLNYRDLLY